MLGQVDVLWVVQVGVGGVQNGVDHSGLQIQQDSTRYVVFVVGLLGNKDRSMR